MNKAKTPPMSREDLNRRLHEIGKLELEIVTLRAEMDAQVDAVRRPYVGKLERRQGKLAELARRLRLLCEDSREALTPGKAKSCDVTFGKIGWRKQPDKMGVQKGRTAEQVCRHLLAAHRKDLLRVTVQLDKKAIAAALADDLITGPEFADAGLYIKPGREDWWYEVDHETVQLHPDA